MNKIAEQIEKTIKSKVLIKKEEKKKGAGIEIFSWASFFAGEEYNQELAKNDEILADNIIDFEKEENQEREFVENKIKEIVNYSSNRQFIEKGDFPVIWFKNIDKTKNESPLQRFLLSALDPAQNYYLSIKEEIIDLSQFVLIVTSSTHDTSKLPNPIFSRLDCINVDTAKPKEFFWDKYFYHFLVASLLAFLALIVLLICFGKNKEEKEN